MQNVIDRKKIKVIKANGEVSMDASPFAFGMLGMSLF